MLCFFVFLLYNQSMIFKEFASFIKGYNIVSLAMAFIMGAASTSLIDSLVKDIIMPIFSPLTEAGNWSEAVLTMGSVSIRYGAFLGELLNFVILGMVVFIIANKILKIEKIGKK